MITVTRLGEFGHRRRRRVRRSIQIYSDSHWGRINSKVEIIWSGLWYVLGRLILWLVKSSSIVGHLTDQNNKQPSIIGHLTNQNVMWPDELDLNANFSIILVLLTGCWGLIWGQKHLSKEICIMIHMVYANLYNFGTTYSLLNFPF